MSANDPKRTSFGLPLLGEGRSYLIGKSLRCIIETWRVSGAGDRALKQNFAKTFALRRLDRWTAPLLPLKEDGRLYRSGIE
jgi:hypothetical protein